MPQPVLKQDHFTYGDYRLWPEDQRWELIDGRAYDLRSFAAQRLF